MKEWLILPGSEGANSGNFRKRHKAWTKLWIVTWCPPGTGETSVTENAVAVQAQQCGTVWVFGKTDKVSMCIQIWGCWEAKRRTLISDEWSEVRKEEMGWKIMLRFQVIFICPWEEFWLLCPWVLQRFWSNSCKSIYKQEILSSNIRGKKLNITMIIIML